MTETENTGDSRIRQINSRINVHFRNSHSEQLNQQNSYFVQNIIISFSSSRNILCPHTHTHTRARVRAHTHKHAHTHKTEVLTLSSHKSNTTGVKQFKHASAVVI